MMTYRTIYEDDHILVIDKPAGIEVSELPHFPAHRLDKDTSGLLVIAKNQDVLQKLQDQFKKRQVTKEYLALVYGEMTKEGELVTEIVRDSSRRVPFKAVAVASGLERGAPRVAKTHWSVIRHLPLVPNPLSLVSVKITTGRTHQIRVHMKYLNHPIMGDQTYSTKPARELSKKLGLGRQFLHAARLEFTHPVSGKKLQFTADLPADLSMDRVGLT